MFFRRNKTRSEKRAHRGFGFDRPGNWHATGTNGVLVLLNLVPVGYLLVYTDRKRMLRKVLELKKSDAVRRLVPLTHS